MRAVQVRRAGAGARGGPPGAAAAAAGCWSALSVLGSSAGGWRLRWVHAVRAKAFNPAGPCVFTLLAPPPPALLLPRGACSGVYWQGGQYARAMGQMTHLISQMALQEGPRAAPGI